MKKFRIRRFLVELRTSPADALFIGMVIVFAVWIAIATTIITYKRLMGEMTSATDHSR